MKKFLIATGGLLSTSGAAFAHPGDHALNMLNSLVHLLTEPDHLAMLLVAALFAGGAVYIYKRRSV
jgi:hydrogenase/urease accessory protein HupE